MPTRGPPLVPKKTTRVLGLVISACTDREASAAAPERASLSISRRSIIRSSLGLSVEAGLSQYGVQRRKPDDDRYRDQRIANAAEHGFAGAAKQGYPKSDADRVDGTDHQCKQQGIAGDETAYRVADGGKQIARAKEQHDVGARDA